MEKLRLMPNILAKRLGGQSLRQLMKNFGLGLLTDQYVDPCNRQMSKKNVGMSTRRPSRYLITAKNNRTIKNITDIKDPYTYPFSKDPNLINIKFYVFICLDETIKLFFKHC